MENQRPGLSLSVPAAAYLLLVGVLLLYAAVVLQQHFPNMYTWEELFINYEGGFIRRGLIGQILLWADRFIPVSIAYLFIYIILFYAFLCSAYAKLIRVFDPLTVIPFFISPALFLLPATDRYVFGRKDLFIEILLFGMALICARCLDEDRPKLRRAALLISILFIAGMLIHEMMLFYFPLFALLLGAAFARQNRIWQWFILMGAVFFSMFFLSTFFSGDAAMREAICASWRQAWPELNCRHALRFIGVSLSDAVMMAMRHHLSAVTIGSVAAGAVLSAIPLALLWMAYRPGAAIRNLLSASPLLGFAFWPAVLGPWLLLAINIDYGRFISCALLAYLFFIYAVCAAAPQPAARWLENGKKSLVASARLRYFACFLALAYGLFWRLLHFAPSGESIVAPGVLFHLQ